MLSSSLHCQDTIRVKIYKYDKVRVHLRKENKYFRGVTLTDFIFSWERVCLFELTDNLQVAKVAEVIDGRLN